VKNSWRAIITAVEKIKQFHHHEDIDSHCAGFPNQPLTLATNPTLGAVVLRTGFDRIIFDRIMKAGVLDFIQNDSAIHHSAIHDSVNSSDGAGNVFRLSQSDSIWATWPDRDGREMRG